MLDAALTAFVLKPGDIGSIGTPPPGGAYMYGPADEARADQGLGPLAHAGNVVEVAAGWSRKLAKTVSPSTTRTTPDQISAAGPRSERTSPGPPPAHAPDRRFR